SVAPQNADLDATIASLVRRGVIADMLVQRPAASSAAPSSANARSQAQALPPAASEAPARIARGATRWRAAGSHRAPAEVNSSAAMADDQLSAPTLAIEPQAQPALADEPGAEEAEEPSSDGAAAEPQSPATAPIADAAGDSPGTAGGEAAPGSPVLAGPALTLQPDAADDLAPIDELSETPAPATDAPGDPIEPEMTGEALDSAPLPPAKPLSQAKPAVRGDVALGEPDRLARPASPGRPPADPKHYQQSEEPSTPAVPLKPLTKNQRLLRDKVRRVLKYYYDRPLSAADRSPWEIMHAMLAFEVHSRVLQGGPASQPITAVGWLCFNQPCKNRTLLYLNEDQQLRVKVGPALQGHHGQLLALLAQARVRSDYPIKVDGQDFTVADLIEVEQATCYPRTELTFKLIGLQRYLDINARWVNDQGMTWDFPTLVREEIRQPVKTAACGGTHRLSGLALAVKKRRASGLPVDGVYADAERLVANHISYAYRLQNSDGSFSTAWFNGPGAEADVDRRLKTTGHILEWLMYASSDEQLTNYRTVRAVNYLTNILYANRTRQWEAGPLGHAIHALVLYDRLVFEKYDRAPESAGPVAAQPRRASR
ncbi:MAG: hypothetical protein DCC67_17815, partial [Planctomycetota bacterium]